MKPKKKSIQSQGGEAKARKMTAEQRTQQAKKMVKAREDKRKREREELERYRKGSQ